MNKPRKKTIKPHFFEAKPNPMFAPWQHAILRFVRYPAAVPCAHCGKKSRHHWTQLVHFKVMEPLLLSLKESAALYSPRAPVCRDHILSPQIENEIAWLINDGCKVLYTPTALSQMRQEEPPKKKGVEPAHEPAP